MDARLKTLGTALGVGLAAAVGTEQLAKTEFMQAHPEAWYGEALAAALLAYVLYKKKHMTAATAIAATAGVLGFQGYRHGSDTAPSSPAAQSPAMPAPAANPALPAPANGNPGVVPPAKPGAGIPPDQYRIPSVSGDVPQAPGEEPGFFDILKNLPGYPYAPMDNTGVMLPRDRAGAMLARDIRTMGRRR